MINSVFSTLQVGYTCLYQVSFKMKEYFTSFAYSLSRQCNYEYTVEPSQVRIIDTMDIYFNFNSITVAATSLKQSIRCCIYLSSESVSDICLANLLLIRKQTGGSIFSTQKSIKLKVSSRDLKHIYCIFYETDNKTMLPLVNPIIENSGIEVVINGTQRMLVSSKVKKMLSTTTDMK